MTEYPEYSFGLIPSSTTLHFTDSLSPLFQLAMRPSIRRVAGNVLQNASSRSYGVRLPNLPTLRHLLTIGDLKPTEFAQLILDAAFLKKAIKHGYYPEGLKDRLLGRTVALMFSKRSTRTRVSTEAAVQMMGGHPMFLGKDDIQLGVSGTTQASLAVT